MHMKSPATASISVVIPVYNGGSNFRMCLESLAESDPSPSEIIVVADGETDGSGRVAESFGAHVLRTPSPKGPGRARNLGAREASGDILFFVDADVTLPQNAISLVSTAFDDDSQMAALMGSYDDAPFQTNFLSQYKNLFHHFVHQTGSQEASTFWGACGAIRRDVFFAMGGFNESYEQPSIEDIELGYRLKKAGHRIRLLKTLQVKHLKRWDTPSLLKADIFYRALPWSRLLLKEGRLINDLNLKVSNRVSVRSVFGLLASMCGALFFPILFIVSGLLMLMLFVLNWDVYRFFLGKRGLLFLLQVIPWHWLYFFYSGMTFAFVFIFVKIRRLLK